MKAHERHQLKENVFAAVVMRTVAAATANSQRLIAVGAIVVVLVAAIGGYLYMRKGQADRAGERFGEAIATQQAAIVPASTLPGATQAAGTFPTEQARDEAALAEFQSVAAAFPGTVVGTAAQYHAAAALMALDRFGEAETAYQAVVGEGASVYTGAARLGLAEAYVRQGRFGEAVSLLIDLAAQRDGALPVDGVLMQLADVHVRAGQKAEARAVFQRVVDEFPQSPYVPQARQQLTLLG
jgi:TolA-binding protein